MQGYLTAYGLSRLLQNQDGEPPALRPEDCWMKWTAADVLLRAAADPRFAESTADFVLSDAGELFQMCVAVFEADLRPVFRSEVNQWAGQFYRRLTEEQIEQAVPEDVRPRLSPENTRAQMLRQAVELCEEADATDGGQRLTTLYADLAKRVYAFKRV
jgi:hypothetical protein